MTDESNLTAESEMDDNWMNMPDPSEGYVPPTVVDSGKEVRVRVVKTKEATPEKRAEGKAYITVTLDFPDEPNAKLMNHTLNIVKPDDLPKDANFKRGQWKDFFEAFNITEAMRNPVNHEGWKSMEARCVVKIDPARPGYEQYGASNSVKQWLR